MNTPLHITRAQAESLLAAVEFELNARLADMLLGEPSRDRLNELAANRSMLLAALQRIGDLESRRVATVNRPW